MSRMLRLGALPHERWYGRLARFPCVSARSRPCSRYCKAPCEAVIAHYHPAFILAAHDSAARDDCHRILRGYGYRIEPESQQPDDNIAVYA